MTKVKADIHLYEVSSLIKTTKCLKCLGLRSDISYEKVKWFCKEISLKLERSLNWLTQ